MTRKAISFADDDRHDLLIDLLEIEPHELLDRLQKLPRAANVPESRPQNEAKRLATGINMAARREILGFGARRKANRDQSLNNVSELLSAAEKFVKKIEKLRQPELRELGRLGWDQSRTAEPIVVFRKDLLKVYGNLKQQPSDSEAFEHIGDLKYKLEDYIADKFAFSFWQITGKRLTFSGSTEHGGLFGQSLNQLFSDLGLKKFGKDKLLQLCKRWKDVQVRHGPEFTRLAALLKID